MPKKLHFLFIVLSLYTITGFSQRIIEKGTVTLNTNEVFQFSNLKFVSGTIVFINTANNAEATYPLNQVRRVEDSQHTTIYGRTDGSASATTKSVDAPVTVKKDSVFKPNYPEGIYATKEEFINKKPGHARRVIPKDIHAGRATLTTIEHNCYFYSPDDKKIKNVFAISYQGHLYFSIKAILNNRHKTDRAQESEFQNSFVRVIMGGENYFYTEADLANLWSKGLWAGGLGGIAGQQIGQTTIHGKGIVWDFKNQHFNIFKHCDDFNDFIKPIYPEGVQEFKDSQPSMVLVRQAIEKVK